MGFRISTYEFGMGHKYSVHNSIRLKTIKFLLKYTGEKNLCNLGQAIVFHNTKHKTKEKVEKVNFTNIKSFALIKTNWENKKTWHRPQQKNIWNMCIKDLNPEYVKDSPNLRIKHERPKFLKMGKRFEQIFNQWKHLNVKQTHERMLNITGVHAC